MFVYWIFKRLIETGTVLDHPQQGRPCIIRTRRLVQTVAARIQWNPVKKQSVVAWELYISKMFMSSMLRSDLGLKAAQQSTSYFLTLRLKEQRAIKSKCLFQHYADNVQMRIFLQMKISSMLRRVYASTSRETHDMAPRIQRDHHPVSVTVLLGSVVWCHHEAPFLWKRDENCCQSMRTPCWSLLWSFLTSLCSVMNIGALSRIWHQGLTPGIFRTPLLWVIPGLLTLQKLRPQPNGLQEWAVLEGKICKNRHPNIEILKRSLMKVVADFPKETLHNSIDGWLRKLEDCVKTKGGSFEK